jgi:hypothetical protein
LPKRNQRRRTAKPARKPLAPPGESPTSQGITVFWMTSLLATVVGEVIALGLRLTWWLDLSPALLTASNLMLLVSAATGVVCLVLTPVVLRWRDTPPPRAITQFAIVASVLPIVTLIAVLAWGT